MKSKLRKLIKEKELQIRKLKSRSEESESVEELKSISSELDRIIGELAALKEMYTEMDKPAEEAHREEMLTGDELPASEEIVAEEITVEDVAEVADTIAEIVDDKIDSEASSEEISDIVEEVLTNELEDIARKKRKKCKGKRFNVMAAMGAEKRKGNTVEKRAKEFAATGRMKIANAEARSVLLSSGKIATPTKVGGINEPGTSVSSIVDMVTVEDMTGIGAYKEAYVDSWQSAGLATEGTASSASDPSFKTVAINPFLLDTVTYVSREIRKQSPLQYEEKVKQGALIALRKKVGEWIVNGNGTNSIYGIANAVNTETSPESMTKTLSVTSATIDEKTLRNIVFEYGTDEEIAGDAVLYLNKKDLIAFGDVRGTNEKGAVYEIEPDGSNPNTGVIKDGGLTVKYCINSALTALSASTRGSSAIKTMVYGNPACYKLGLFGDYEVNVSEDYKFAEGLLSIRGEVMVGGNVTHKDGFVVVTLAASA